MMTVKNRPNQYVKRAELPGRSLHVKNVSSKLAAKPKERDFAKACIDNRFYFTFLTDEVYKKS